VIDIPDGAGGMHGAYTYRYARETVGEHQLRAAVENRELVGFGRGVLLDARRMYDLRTRCAGALLLTDGVLVGPTAAALHGCTAACGFPVHVRVPYDRRLRSRGGLVVHQGASVPDRDVTVIDGLRVLVADLAIADLLCTATRRTALACADQALRSLRADDRAGFVRDVSERLARRTDRRGTRQAAALLSLATGLPESPAQSTLLLVLTEAGLPQPECQYPIRGRSGLVRHRLDFAWPDSRVALECDEATGTETREEELRARGWHVLRADAQDLVDPTELCRDVRKALGVRSKAA
jgi:hypothetical protein